MLGFVIRLIGWALVLGLAARLADASWGQAGLQGVAELQAFHDTGITALLAAPLLLAALGVGPLRPLILFAGFFLAGAALTAPFAIARVAGA